MMDQWTRVSSCLIVSFHFSDARSWDVDERAGCVDVKTPGMFGSRMRCP